MAKKLFRCIFAKSGPYLLSALLLGCGVQLDTPAPPIVWVIGIDVTTSLPQEHFVVMRDQMIPTLVLSRLKSRDEVHILRIDSDPEDQITVTPVRASRLGLEQDIADLFAQHIQPIAQPDGYQGMTNIGGVLAYANRIAQLRETNGAQPGRLVVSIFSDGKREGTQATPTQAWPSEVQVWFWGVEPLQEQPLTDWALQDMQLSPEQVHVARWSDWETMAQVFGHTIARREQQQMPAAASSPADTRHS